MDYIGADREAFPRTIPDVPNSGQASPGAQPLSRPSRPRIRKISLASPFPSSSSKPASISIDVAAHRTVGPHDSSLVPDTPRQTGESPAHSPIRHLHRRVPSATMPWESKNIAHTRSDSVTSRASGTQTLGRRMGVPTSPPNAWYHRSSNGRPNSRSSSPTPSNFSQEGSMSSIGGSERIQVGGQYTSSPRSLAGLRRSWNQKINRSVQEDPLALIPAPGYEHYADFHPNPVGSPASEGHSQKEKRRLFGRKSELPSLTTQTEKGVLRRVSSRTLFGANKERSFDTNGSTDTLASTATSSTARMELTKKAGDALKPQWPHRSRKNKRMSREGTVESGDSHSSFAGSTGGLGNEENGAESTIRIKNLSTSPSQSSDQANMSAQAVQDSEGLPKRLSGWLSNMLHHGASATHLPVNEEGGISGSSSSFTLRKKTSSLSLSTREDGDKSRTTLAPSSQTDSANNNAASSPSSRIKSGGLLSSLTVVGRGRADTSSSMSGGGSASGPRGGLDRALRYFLDSGESIEPQDEGIWLLGVWHAPHEGVHDKSPLSPDTHRPLIEVTRTPPTPPAGQASAAEGETSSVSRGGSDFDHDGYSTADSSRKTRGTSPSIASASSHGSATPHDKSSPVAIANTPTLRNPEQNGIESVFTRNNPTPQGSPAIAARAAEASSVHDSKALARSSERRATQTKSFQADFSSRIWCTYRSHFIPISRDGNISKEAECAAAELAASRLCSSNGDERNVATSMSARTLSRRGDEGPSAPNGSAPIQVPLNSSAAPPASQGLGERMGLPGLWSRATAAAQAYGLSGRSGLTTDAGWGCMLRTGQSLLANALLNVHLGREWRRQPRPALTTRYDHLEHSTEWHRKREDYACYVRLITWFLDEPSKACPFGVHRMAREGKRLGKEVGEWFGPSTAAGAIKKLVDDFPEAGLGVNLASDGVVYLDQVKAQALGAEQGKQRSSGEWNRPVLVLIGIRLGLEGVHPMYYDSIKTTFSFQHSVGIAGGRPSSSYYFVGYQGNSLFYLDPHHVRSNVPFRHPPPDLVDETSWWAQEYSEVELATYHNDRARRMPMKSLDPSMLLGFLITDEDSLRDFVTRVKSLPRPIFSVLESMPKWMLEDDEEGLQDDDKALESLSEGSLEDSEICPPGVGKEGVVAVRLKDDDERAREQARGLAFGEEPIAVNRSIMSNRTTTPRSESTFEFIDRQAAGTAASPPSSPAEMRNHLVFLDAERGLRQEPSTAETLRSNKSFGESDIGSAWEEVGDTSSHTREPMSSPVEATSQRERSPP